MAQQYVFTLQSRNVLIAQTLNYLQLDCDHIIC